MATTGKQRKAIIGNSKNFWLHSSRENRFDLTHPSPPSSEPISPRLDLNASNTPVTLDPQKTALVIIDMQNFFLSEGFGRKRGAGHTAAENLEKYAVPAARKAGMQVIWLNWGLTDEDIESMPPAVKRAFGFEAVVDDEGDEVEAETANGDVFRDHEKHRGKVLENGKDARIYKGLGASCGEVELADGTVVDAGRLLMRDSWNSALYPPLDAMYEQGRTLARKPDVWIHKDRMSGLWGARTDCEDFLQSNGIRSLLFAGVNTDQCVSGTLTDAFSKGYDCIMLKDGCGTTSPDFSQQCIEYNAAKCWGFVATCEDLAKGVDDMVSR